VPGGSGSSRARPRPPFFHPLSAKRATEPGAALEPGAKGRSSASRWSWWKTFHDGRHWTVATKWDDIILDPRGGEVLRVVELRQARSLLE